LFWFDSTRLHEGKKSLGDVVDFLLWSGEALHTNEISPAFSALARGKKPIGFSMVGEKNLLCEHIGTARSKASTLFVNQDLAK